MSSSDFNLLLEASLDLLSTSIKSSTSGLGPANSWEIDPLHRPAASTSSSLSSTSALTHNGEKDALSLNKDSMMEIANLAKLVKKSRKGNSSNHSQSKEVKDDNEIYSTPDGQRASLESGSEIGSKEDCSISCLPPETLARVLRYARENLEQSDPVNATSSRRIRTTRANASFGRWAGPSSPNALFAQCK